MADSPKTDRFEGGRADHSPAENMQYGQMTRCLRIENPIELYSSTLTKFCDLFGKDRELATIASEEILSFLAEITAGGKQRGARLLQFPCTGIAVQRMPIERLSLNDSPPNSYLGRASVMSLRSVINASSANVPCCTPLYSTSNSPAG